MSTTLSTSPATITQDLAPIIEKVNQLLASGDTQRADAIAARLKKESGAISLRVAQAGSAKKDLNTAQQSAPESTPSRLMAFPFTELAAHPALLERGIDLQQQLDSHVQMMIAMGIIPEDQRITYAQKFATISVNLDELAKAPKNWRPQLFLDDMTPDQALNTYIKNTQVTVFEWATISRYKKVSPKTKQRLHDDQKQLPSGLSRFTFTSKNSTGKTANYQLAQQEKGINHMQPKQWFQMFMEALNTAIKTLKLSDKAWKDLSEEEKVAILENRAINQFLPDVSTVTQCPEYRDENGSVLGLYWDPGRCRVYVYGYYPDVPRGSLGVREVLG